MPESSDLVLDPAALDPYTGGDKSLARDFYAQFLDSTQSDVAELRNAMTVGDLRLIAAAAHRVKSSSRMVGANAQAGAAERIEKSARADDLPGCRAAQIEFDRAHTRLIERLETVAA